MPSVQTDPTADNRVLAESVYDMIMDEIEPDLLLANIPLMDAKYAGESTEQHDARMKRYVVAYKKFDLELNKFMTDIDTKVRITQRVALKQKEAESQLQEANTLHSIASAFN